MESINQLLAVCVLIFQINNGSVIGNASGFFYLSQGQIFLVTNYHVIRDEKNSKQPDTLKFRLHLDKNDLRKNQYVSAKLYRGGQPNFYIHPNYNENKADIAIIKLNKNALQKKYYFKALSKENFLPNDIFLPLGEDVMIIGFPYGISDSLNNLPIVRKGMISSLYKIGFEGSPFFLIDANLHPGTSGSPVFTKSTNIRSGKTGGTRILSGNPIYFLGIQSSVVNSKKSKKGFMPLGLATVWHSNLIEEIIESIPKPVPTQEDLK